VRQNGWFTRYTALFAALRVRGGVLRFCVHFARFRLCLFLVPAMAGLTNEHAAKDHLQHRTTAIWLVGFCVFWFNLLRRAAVRPVYSSDAFHLFAIY
jgi:hypothetical protein